MPKHEVTKSDSERIQSSQVTHLLSPTLSKWRLTTTRPRAAATCPREDSVPEHRARAIGTLHRVGRLRVPGRPEETRKETRLLARSKCNCGIKQPRPEKGGRSGWLHGTWSHGILETQITRSISFITVSSSGPPKLYLPWQSSVIYSNIRLKPHIVCLVRSDELSAH